MSRLDFFRLYVADIYLNFCNNKWVFLVAATVTILDVM